MTTKRGSPSSTNTETFAGVTGPPGTSCTRGADDPNEITIVNHFPSKEQASAFVADPSLRAAIEQGGVIGEPRITWARHVETVDYQAKAA